MGTKMQASLLRRAIEAGKAKANEWNVCDPPSSIPIEAAKQIVIAAIGSIEDIRETEDLGLGHLQRDEHQAWLAVVKEMREAGVGAINQGERYETLAYAIMRWGEELAQLRLADPNTDHAENALKEKRELYP